jgi:hypothetical protein
VAVPPKRKEKREKNEEELDLFYFSLLAPPNWPTFASFGTQKGDM